jgi:hypothetical protein
MGKWAALVSHTIGSREKVRFVEEVESCHVDAHMPHPGPKVITSVLS